VLGLAEIIANYTLSTPTFIDLAKAAAIESHYEIGYSTNVMFPADGTFEDYSWTKG
jgi:hypothetical protein